MMKKAFLCLLILISATVLRAQNDYSNNTNDNAPQGFQKQNIFIGGSVSLGFGSGSFGVGANPEIGYSVAPWLDAGLAFNINYNSQKIYAFDNTGLQTQGKISSFNYGAGIFARAYPLSFLFVQFQPEVNWINYSQKDNYSGLKATTTVSAPSLIGGIGYSQRVIGQGSYFLMIGLDLLNDTNSPYQDGYGHAQPIIRGGFDVYLRPSRKPRPVGNQL